VKLTVVAVGRLRSEAARAGCDDYVGRLSPLLPGRVVEVRDVPRQKKGDPDRWRAEEGRNLLAAVPPGALVVALDERGRAWDSRGFAQWLGQQRDAGVPEIAFLIGGPDGLDPEVRAKARVVWSLSPLTFPHELARLVLLEQLYRAATLLAGWPYHR
jgi:23S rRNA (pseudouridine1915-N3)-methyltransferase